MLRYHLANVLEILSRQNIAITLLTIWYFFLQKNTLKSVERSTNLHRAATMAIGFKMFCNTDFLMDFAVRLCCVVTVSYLGMTMTLGTASVCLTVFVLNLHYHATFVPVPRWVRVVFLRHCARLFGFCDHRTSTLLDPASIISGTAGVNAVSKKVAEATNETSPQQQSPVFIRRPPPSRRRTSLAVSVGDLRRTSDSTLDPSKALHPLPVSAALTGTGRSNSYCRMIAEREENGGGGGSTGSRRVSPVCWTDHVITGSGRSLAGDESRDLEAILHEWQLLARVLDRLFFVVCFTLMLASALFILLSPWYARSEQTIS